MKIAIIGAMWDEVSYLINHISSCSKNTIHTYDFYEGKYLNIDLVIVESGVGKVSAGMLITMLLTQYPDIEKVINIGVAGGIKSKVNIGSIVVNQQSMYGDVDVTSAGNYRFGQMCGFPEVFEADRELIQLIKQKMKTPYLLGSVITSDKFITSAEDMQTMIQTYFHQYNVHCVDMESAAFAQACFFFEKDFLSIRAISDVIGSNLHQEFDQNLAFASQKSTEFIVDFLKILSS